VSTEDKTKYGVPLSQLAGSNGKRKTAALFLENNYHRESEDPAPFTLKDRDHRGKISLKRIYMECEDPTEYMFSQAAFGSWEHWEVLKNSTFFKPYAEAWKKELETKIRAEAILTIRQDALHNPTSAKWLAEKGWEPKATKGRPSKAEVDRERKRLAEQADTLESDAGRIFE
tara:strand:+ start:27882 stop:28397 length:516 start_codon:yes stop_codon:yes gene_type:complete